MIKPLPCPESHINSPWSKCNGEITVAASSKDRNGISSYGATCSKCRNWVGEFVGNGRKDNATHQWNKYAKQRAKELGVKHER